jgi:hypothetical protein
MVKDLRGGRESTGKRENGSLKGGEIFNGIIRKSEHTS